MREMNDKVVISLILGGSSILVIGMILFGIFVVNSESTNAYELGQRSAKQHLPIIANPNGAQFSRSYLEGYLDYVENNE